MDVVLGVAVTGPVARLALIGAGADGSDVIDQSVVDLANNPVEQLTETVVGTNRLLASENHRLVGTRLCWTDHPSADQLRQALEDSGVHNVAVLVAVAGGHVADARGGAVRRRAGALTTTRRRCRCWIRPSDRPGRAAHVAGAAGSSAGGDATGRVGHDDGRLGDQPGRPNDVYLVGASADLDRVADQLRETSTMRVQIAEDPTFALARGAAIAAAPLTPDATAMAPAVGLTGDETAMAPAAGLTGDETAIVPAEFGDPNAADQQLAYSMADDDAELLPGEVDEFDELLRRSRRRDRPAEARADAHCWSAMRSSRSRSSDSLRWPSRWSSPSGRPRARSRWWDTRTPPRASSCRCCRPSSRRRYRRPHPKRPTRDTRAASFRLPSRRPGARSRARYRSPP